MTKEEIVKAAASKLMGWRLPKDFSPDCHVSFDSEKALQSSWPVGTNLFTYQQAKEMLEYCLPDEV